ncbi:MAG: ribonuclease HII [Oscillospiraceae bacterium]|jgi:ribonuclease HII|nr:ribonuclease HII [Oscillospiraceae bacterium]
MFALNGEPLSIVNYQLSIDKLAGTDEAGRGPLAGPVFAAAVILTAPIAGLDDSKKLTAKRRELLYSTIVENAAAYAIASVSAAEVDEINILQASQLAMNRAIEALPIVPEFVLVDGNYTKSINYPCAAIVGGDGIYQCIAAASILAKVARDRYMTELALTYPQYAFEKHKGYGTKVHYERLREYGASPEHRKTFLH